MKLVLMAFGLLTISSSVVAHHSLHHDHSHNSDSIEEHNPHAVEETLYFSQKSKNELRSKAFEYLVFDESVGKEIVSPLGDTRFPYGAIGEISQVMSIAGGHMAFKMSRVKAAFDVNESEV